MQATNITTGNVKPIAASGSVPRRDTKYVSAKLNVVIANVPPSMGTAMPNSFLTTGPSVRSFLALTANTHPSPVPRRWPSPDPP